METTEEEKTMMETKKEDPPAKKAPEYTKEHILTFRQYAKRRDLLSVLLKDEKRYTKEQVDKILQKFMKKEKVK